MYPIIEDVCKKMTAYIERQLDKSTLKLTAIDAKEVLTISLKHNA